MVKWCGVMVWRGADVHGKGMAGSSLAMAGSSLAMAGFGLVVPSSGIVLLCVGVVRFSKVLQGCGPVRSGHEELRWGKVPLRCVGQGQITVRFCSAMVS